MADKDKDKTLDTVLYDDYFSEPGDKGVAAIIEHRGKKLRFWLRKSLTLDEKQKAADAAIEFTLDAEGKPTITKMSQAEYTRQVVLTGTKKWPFEFSPGKPVPVSEKFVKMLDGDLADKIAAVILGQRQAQEDALVPFEMKSGEDSSQEEQQAQS